MSTYVVTPTVEQEKLMQTFFEEQHIIFFKEDDEELPDHVLKGIAEGEADFEAGRTVSLDDFKKKLLMFK